MNSGIPTGTARQAFIKECTKPLSLLGSNNAATSQYEEQPDRSMKPRSNFLPMGTGWDLANL